MIQMHVKLSKTVISNLTFSLSNIGIIQIENCFGTFTIYILHNSFISEIMNFDTLKLESKLGYFGQEKNVINVTFLTSY